MSAELMKSKFVRRPSVCGIDYLSTLCTDFFQILVVASPGPYAQTFFSFLKKLKISIFYEYFSFSLTWDPTGAKISKRYSSYNSQPKVFKLFLNFLPNSPHKTTFGIFEHWNFKKFYLLSLTRWWKFRNATSPTNLVLNFPPNGPHKITFGIFKILSFRFLMSFFENFDSTILVSMEKSKPQWSGKRAIVEQNGVKLGLVGSNSKYVGYLWPCSVHGHFEVIQCAFDFS